MNNELIDSLVIENDTKIIFLVIDGLGGLPVEEKGGSELQVANKPYLDALAATSACGLFDPVAPGVTPGSGPGHFAIFGYDPVEGNIGRGVLSAAGLGFELTDRDVAARANFATLDENGMVKDRRAGRLDTNTNKRLCKMVRENIRTIDGVEIFIETEKEHRALLVLRGDNLSNHIEDTDPQLTGVIPIIAKGTSPEGERTANVVAEFTDRVRKLLGSEEKANMILLRGFAKKKVYKSIKERFGLNALAIANYPMYRGLAWLVGMKLHPVTPDYETEFAALRENYSKYDFFFLHIKHTDSRGEDGDFDAKVRAIEDVDRMIPLLMDLNPDVLAITGDHSTPSKLAAHSWHPVPVLLRSKYAFVDGVRSFDELACATGILGRQPMKNLMPLALAHAGRLKKYGA